MEINGSAIVARMHWVQSRGLADWASRKGPGWVLGDGQVMPCGRYGIGCWGGISCFLSHCFQKGATDAGRRLPRGLPRRGRRGGLAGDMGWELPMIVPFCPELSHLTGLSAFGSTEVGGNSGFPSQTVPLGLAGRDRRVGGRVRL